MVKNQNNYFIEIQPLTPETIVDVIRYMNKRIYGVFEENGSSCIHKRLLDIYCKYLQLEDITYSVIEDGINDNEPPLKKSKKRRTQCEYQNDTKRMHNYYIQI